MKHLILTLFCLGLSGCAVWIPTPNPRVEPPELRGDHGLKIGGAVSGSHKYESSPDGARRPPKTDDPEIQGFADTEGSLLYSPILPLEFGIEAHPYSMGISGVVKWQPLGEGTRTAGKGNVPIGTYLRVGSYSSTRSGDQKSIFGAGGYNWKASVDGTFVHAGFSLGYRTNEHMLIYGGAAFGQYWNSTKIDQDASGTDPGGVYKVSDTGHGQTFGSGMQFNWHIVQFYVGADWTHIRYQHAGIVDGVYFNGGFYFTPR